MRSPVFLADQLFLLYHISFILSSTFFKFFSKSFRDVRYPFGGQLIYYITFLLSCQVLFSNFFEIFSLDFLSKRKDNIQVFIVSNSTSLTSLLCCASSLTVPLVLSRPTIILLYHHISILSTQNLYEVFFFFC